MKNKLSNYAFIDGANLHRGIKDLGWELDYGKFRIWLKEKYCVSKAYIFLGLVSNNGDLYHSLREAGFSLIFKEITFDNFGRVKGNCDADLVLSVVSNFYEKRFNQAIIVSSDGDYAAMVKFLKYKKVFHTLLSPHDKCSFLLRKLNIKIVYLGTQRSILSLNKKAPSEDETSQGSFS